MSSSNDCFWYCFCLCLIIHPPFLLGLLQPKVEMMPEGSWMDSSYVGLTHNLLGIAITCSLRALLVSSKSKLYHSRSYLKTFSGIPPHLSSPHVGSDQVHLCKDIQDIFQKMQIYTFEIVFHLRRRHIYSHTRWKNISDNTDDRSTDFDIVVHPTRRHIHLQTHRGSALVEPGRQSWAVIGSSYHLVYLFCQKIAKIIQKKKTLARIYQENWVFFRLVAMKTSSEMSSWNPCPPSRGVGMLASSSWYPGPPSCWGIGMMVPFSYQCSHSRLTHNDQLSFVLFLCSLFNNEGPGA